MILATAAFISSGKDAAALTADDVLSKMNADQRIGFIDGIVEGFATARWVQDKPNAEGMQCILDWYYRGETEQVWNQVMAWFERHPDQQAGILMHVLIKKECGE